MCYELKIYPDIHSLFEWSNWMTPFSYPRQFDTVFFVAILEDIAATEINENEVQKIEVCMVDYLTQRRRNIISKGH